MNQDERLERFQMLVLEAYARLLPIKGIKWSDLTLIKSLDVIGNNLVIELGPEAKGMGNSVMGFLSTYAVMAGFQNAEFKYG